MYAGTFDPVDEFYVFAFNANVDNGGVDPSHLTDANVIDFVTNNTAYFASLTSGVVNNNTVGTNGGSVYFDSADIAANSSRTLSSSTLLLTKAFNNLIDVDSASAVQSTNHISDFATIVIAKDFAAPPNYKIASKYIVPIARYWRITARGTDDRDSDKQWTNGLGNYELGSGWICPYHRARLDVTDLAITTELPQSQYVAGLTTTNTVDNSTKFSLLLQQTVAEQHVYINDRWLATQVEFEGVTYHTAGYTIEFTEAITLNEWMYSRHQNGSQSTNPYIVTIEYSNDGITFETDVVYVRNSTDPTRPDLKQIANPSGAVAYGFNVLQRINGKWQDSVIKEFSSAAAPA